MSYPITESTFYNDKNTIKILIKNIFYLLQIQVRMSANNHLKKREQKIKISH